MTAWLTIFKLLLMLADKIADVIRANQLMNAGETREVAKQLAMIEGRLGITEQIRRDVDKMTDAEIDEELGRTDDI